MHGTPIRGFLLHSLPQWGEMVQFIVTPFWEVVLLQMLGHKDFPMAQHFLQTLPGKLVPHQIQAILFRMWGIHPMRDGIPRLLLIYHFW